MYEKISIPINIGNNAKGHWGMKIYKNFSWCLMIPITKMPEQTLTDNQTIIIIWLVKANPNGNKPKRFNPRIKLNKQPTNGIYIYPNKPIWAVIKLKINIMLFSKSNWKSDGISLKFSLK